MKKTSLIVCILFLSMATRAQNSTFGTITFDKQAEQGIIAEYNSNEDAVRAVLLQEISKAGVKGKSVKGFTAYKGVQINEIYNDVIDLYVKTERKSKKEKDKTIVSMLIS